MTKPTIEEDYAVVRYSLARLEEQGWWQMGYKEEVYSYFKDALELDVYGISPGGFAELVLDAPTIEEFKELRDWTYG